MSRPFVELGTVVEIVMGQAPPGSACNKEGIGVIFVKAGEFQERSPDIREWTTQPLKMAASKDTLVCVVGATAGKVNYSTFECAIGRSVAAVRAQPDLLDPEFLYHFLRTKVGVLRDRSQGAAQGVITREMLQVLTLPLPPLAEQRRIAAILDQADALRAKRRESLAQLETLKQSIFLDMFGDPLSNPKGWQIVRLGSETVKMGSGSTPTGGDASYKESGISLIRSLNVHDGEFIYKNLAHIDEQQASRLSGVIVEVNDVLLNITGASVARVCRAPKDVLPARVNQHVMIIRPVSRLRSSFLERLLLSPQMKSHLLLAGGSGATREAITKAQAEDLRIICPPIELQIHFEERLNSVACLMNNNTHSSKQLTNLFASLQHRAFRGEL